MIYQEGIGVLIGAFSWCARLRGLFAWKHTDKTLLLAPCRSIHTYGMKRALDIAFINQHGEVIKVIKMLRPWSRVSCCGAHAVCERFSCDDAWFKEGDQLVIGVERASLIKVQKGSAITRKDA